MPLVLLHGGGSTIDVTFGRVLPVFAANRRVIAVEEQGHGRTTDREGPVKTPTTRTKTLLVQPSETEEDIGLPRVRTARADRCLRYIQISPETATSGSLGPVNLASGG